MTVPCVVTCRSGIGAIRRVSSRAIPTGPMRGTVRSTSARLLAVLSLTGSAVALLPTAGSATALGPAGTYSFTGAGFGHGLGMSQYGAKAFADAGWDPGRILAHYYQGTQVSDVATRPLRVHLADVGQSAGAAVSVTTSGPIQVTADGVSGAGPVFPDTTPPGAGAVTFEADPAGPGVQVRQNGSVLMRAPGSVALSPEASPPSQCGPDVVSQGPCFGLSATGKRYRYGATEVSRIGGDLRIVVRDLPMQDYLYGLAEMPSSWNVNALQVQAVAARSYALDKQNRSGDRRPGCDCTLLSDTRDQVYAGLEKEAGANATGRRYAANWRLAVDVTDSKVEILPGSGVITALYSSSSGGHTENNENVFGGAPISYLRGVPDADDNPSNPLRSWVRSYPAATLSGWLAADPSTDVGSLQAIEVDNAFGVSGRPLAVRLVGSSGVKQVTGERLRAVINARAANCYQAAVSSCDLPSSLFQVAWESYARTFRGGTFVAAGGDGNPLFVTGPDAGMPSIVRVRRADSSTPVTFDAYPGFTGGVRVAVCRSPDGGPPKIVTGPGPGGGPDVRVFTLQGQLLGNFNAYGAFGGGVYVGCADVDGQPGDEIITGAGPGGGPDVGVWRLGGGKIDGFYAFDSSFTGGVRVAGGQVFGDPREEVVAAAGPGGNPDVRVVTDVGTAVRRIAPGGAFHAFEASFRGGVYVAVAAGVPTGAIVTGAGDSGGSRVVARRLGEANPILDNIVFAGPMGGGARVAWGPGLGILASTGVGAWPLVRAVP